MFTKKADAISISSPVTSGGGTPVGLAGGILPADITKPTHVLWHALDGCQVTLPEDAAALVNDFPDVAGVELDGGFDDTMVENPCGASSYHGFLGIESYAVTTTADWIDALTLMPPVRPRRLKTHGSPRPPDPSFVQQIVVIPDI